MANTYVGAGGVWSQNRYTYSGDDALWKTAKNKLDRDYMVSKKRKKVQKKYGYDPANKAKFQANLDALEEKGINKDSIRIRKLESQLASGRGDFVIRNMLKHLKAGTNTSRSGNQKVAQATPTLTAPTTAFGKSVANQKKTGTIDSKPVAIPKGSKERVRERGSKGRVRERKTIKGRARVALRNKE